MSDLLFKKYFLYLHSMKDKVIIKEIDWENITTVDQIKQLLQGIELKFVFDKNNPATKSKIEVLKFKGLIK